MQIRRVNAVCSPDAQPEQCNSTTPTAVSWLASDLDGVIEGLSPHPLSMHAMDPEGKMWGHHDTKYMVDPGLSRDMHVHFFAGMNGTVRATAKTDCLRLLHLYQLYRVRGRKPAPARSGINTTVKPATAANSSQGLRPLGSISSTPSQAAAVPGASAKVVGNAAEGNGVEGVEQPEVNRSPSALPKIKVLNAYTVQELMKYNAAANEDEDNMDTANTRSGDSTRTASKMRRLLNTLFSGTSGGSSRCGSRHMMQNRKQRSRKLPQQKQDPTVAYDMLIDMLFRHRKLVAVPVSSDYNGDKRSETRRNDPSSSSSSSSSVSEVTPGDASGDVDWFWPADWLQSEEGQEIVGRLFKRGTFAEVDEDILGSNASLIGRSKKTDDGVESS